MIEPIAIIGRGCVLPGALSPAEFQSSILAGRSLLSDPDPGLYGLDFALLDRWKNPIAAELARLKKPVPGGYVRGFDSVFRPSDFGAQTERFQGLDPVFLWPLHSIFEAFKEAGLDPADHSRTDIILGNLSYPNPGLTRFAHDVLLGNSIGPDAKNRAANRFSSGYPAHFAAGLLGFSGEAFCLDAACASSLYAIKLACDRLRSREAELAVAGGVQHADFLLLHSGFTSLQALSPSGQSRPFHRDADGLLPAEGAAVVLLKRLSDAERDGDSVLGVIRAVGLSNDGRQRGFLAPDEDGQVRAMRAAYDSIGLDPADMDWVECHATGTAVGDAVEIRSLARVFEGRSDLPVGSLKSNTGHLLAASGCAAVLKVIGALEAGVIPSSLHSDLPNAAFSGTAVRPVQTSEPWPSNKLRRAAINGFGFGGTNAHLILEEYQRSSRPVAPGFSDGLNPAPIAICGIAAVSPETPDAESFEALLLDESTTVRPAAAESRGIDVRELRFPPLDLKRALPQQTIVLESAIESVRMVPGLDPQKTGVLIGMGCDPSASRFCLRARLAELLKARDGDALLESISNEWSLHLDRVEPPLTPAVVLGTMPNIVTNRLNAHFNWGGWGFSVSSEELSGIAALRIAVRALQSGELDAVLVGAVDLCRDPVHASASRILLPPESQNAADIAVTMILRREADARRDGHHVQALLSFEKSGETGGPSAPIVTEKLGHSHAASGLLQVAAAAICCDRGIGFKANSPRPVPWLVPAGGGSIQVEVSSFTGRKDRLSLLPVSEPSQVTIVGGCPIVRSFAGRDAGEILERMESGIEGGGGPARLAVVIPREGGRAGTDITLAAVQFLRSGASGPAPTGVYFRAAPISGELAFIFTGAASALPGTGRELFLSIPALGKGLARKFPMLARVAEEHFNADPSVPMLPFEQLRSCALICQAHAWMSRELFGLQPSAVLGLSSGETNSLFAMGAWGDMEEMFEEIRASGMYGTALTGRFEAARLAWKVEGQVQWKNWRLLAPVDEVMAAVELESRVHVTIVQGSADCVIGGEASSCERVIAKFGSHRAIDLGHDMIVHCPELGPFAGTWRRIHRRATVAPAGVRFYSHALGGSYAVDADSVADALTGQALHPIDLRHSIEPAWGDGVRIFIEHGPRNVLTGSIQQILQGREFLALAWDRPGTHPVDQMAHVAAQLFVAGVDVRLELFQASGQKPALESTTDAGSRLRFPFHLPSIQIPSLPAPAPGETVPYERMKPAPALPPIDFEEPDFNAVRDIIHFPSNDRNGVDEHSDTGAERSSEAEHPVRVRILSEVSSAHQEFLAQQARIYLEFLELQNQFLKPSAATLEHRIHSVPVQVQAEPEPVITEAEQTFPSFTREELEVLASGSISSIFGPAFAAQDVYERQVRLPQPPLLLVDRVTRIEGEPGSMGLGRVDTETDVLEGAWYLHHGRMSPGVVVESGQADLLLISWLGVDALNRGDRVYRLLGCKLKFHEGGLPQPGETLKFQIHVDGHARTGEVRLFFFHYDCWIGERLVLSVREGQAGFFSDQELADSGGVLWDPAGDKPRPDARMDAPPKCTEKRSFSREDVSAFVEGRAVDCFGRGFEMAACHTRTPRIPGGRLAMIDSVPEFDPVGGPWGRGYLRAETVVRPDAWFYSGHFLNDPCMPGTLMADAAMQALAFFFAALGFTIDRDGWRFEPVPGETFELKCRGQVIPDGDHLLTYEIFVEEIVGGPQPEIYGALLCSSDGFKVFQCRRIGIRLVPDWPLGELRHKLLRGVEPRYLQSTSDVRGDYAALLACAWGRPSDAFGSMFNKFDGPRRVPRLPGPPYHFMTRVVEVVGTPGRSDDGSRVVVEYDVPESDWYFSENAAPVMPFSVLLEVALQPCGWLAVFMGSALHVPEDLCFRNLDGFDAKLALEIKPGSGTIRTESALIRENRVGRLTLLFFRVVCYQNGRQVITFDTSFGFFDAEALATQKGLPTTEAQKEILNRSSDVAIDLTQPGELRAQGRPRLASGSLLMVDKITGWWPQAGSAGLGQIRGWQKIRSSAWYFRAHFFQDPVQPGSLGIEALLQLLQCQMLMAGLDREVTNGRFEPLATGVVFKWKYRGQVRPYNREVTTNLEITRIDRDEFGILAVAAGSLWVDGMRIYEVENLGMRIVPGNAMNAGVEELVIDVQDTPWLRDHCPTFSLPALPIMGAANLMRASLARQGRNVIGIEQLELKRWVICDGPHLRLRLEATEVSAGLDEVRLFVHAATAASPVLAGRGLFRSASSLPPQPAKLAPLKATEPMPNPYLEGTVFHGPSLQVIQTWRLSSEGASATINLDAIASREEIEDWSVILLDGILHAIPHDSPEQFFGSKAAGFAAFPRRIVRLDVHGPTPKSGVLGIEVRPLRLSEDGRLVELLIQACSDSGVWVQLIIEEALMTKGTIGCLAPSKRRDFLLHRRWVPEAILSTFDEIGSSLTQETVHLCNWFPGTAERVFAVEGSIASVTRQIAAKEFASRIARIHPSLIELRGDNAVSPTHPCNPIPLRIEVSDGVVRVSESAVQENRMDLSELSRSWERITGTHGSPAEQIHFAILQRFLGRIHVLDPGGFASVRGRACLFLGNHQVAIESLLLSVVGGGLMGHPILTIAKQEHRTTWLGRLIARLDQCPGIQLPRSMAFFNREDPASMLSLLEDLRLSTAANKASIMVHAEGTRSIQCRRPVSQVSGVFIDLALQQKLPIIPVRFAGGLPVDVAPGAERLEYPVGFGKQEIYLGSPIFPEDLARLGLLERKTRVCSALNSLGPDLMVETPSRPDPEFEKAVNALVAESSLHAAKAAIVATLEQETQIDPGIREIARFLRDQKSPPSGTPIQNWIGLLHDWARE